MDVMASIFTRDEQGKEQQRDELLFKLLKSPSQPRPKCERKYKRKSKENPPAKLPEFQVKRPLGDSNPTSISINTQAEIIVVSIVRSAALP